LNADLLYHVLLALAVVVVFGHVLGRLMALIGQPPVIGEVLSGILLGPSLVGRLFPGSETYLFPESVRPVLSVLAQLGVALYMFVVGLEFDAASLRQRAAPFVFTALASIAVPFALGSGLSHLIYQDYSAPPVRLLAFALFMGVATSITAFPVLARILTDRGLAKTDLGVAALTCAAVNDVAAWCLLAVAVGVARTTMSTALQATLMTLGFIAFMFLVVGPVAARFAHRRQDPDQLSSDTITWTLVAMLASAVAAEVIGIHAIFGAFLFGAILPPESAIARHLALHRTPVVTLLLLPAFFALTGLRTEIGLLSGSRDWTVCLLVIVIATAGKFGGTAVAARLAGMPWRFAGELGALMNTRGLMELVVLNVGLDLGVISPRLFTMMVIMAIATTAMTAPLLDLLRARPPRGFREGHR